jgi:hypothetical protein
MSKIVEVTHDGDYGEVTVELGKGHKEKWLYERIDSKDGGHSLVSWVMIGREELKK